MWGLPDFLLTEKQIEANRRWAEREIERRTAITVPWNPNMKWQKELNIQGSTYKPLSLFKVKRTGNDIHESKSCHLIVSPNKTFCYCEKLLKRGQQLETVNGKQRGTVMFDTDVLVPALHEKSNWEERWEKSPWMSLTPLEIFTLRPGTKRAKGSVVIVGLGLGHQLIEVSKRKNVGKLVLVEKSRELIDWLLPRIKPHLARELDDIIVGDAFLELPKLTADVALVDIFRHYGSNCYQRKELERTCRNIKFIWAWGSAEL